MFYRYGAALAGLCLLLPPQLAVDPLEMEVLADFFPLPTGFGMLRGFPRFHVALPSTEIVAQRHKLLPHS